MRYLWTFIFSGIFIILVMSIIIPFISADTTNISEAITLTNESDQIIFGNSSPQNRSTNSTMITLISESEDIARSMLKESKNERIYADEINSMNSSSGKKSISMESWGNTTVSTVNNSANSTNLTTQYNSLGEIIKAKDWNALSEYKCRIKTENPGYFADSDISSTGSKTKWNNYFNPPLPPVSSSSCCG